MDRSFPFYVKLYSFKDELDPCPPNWHERLEIFIPVAGEGLFRIGDRLFTFAAGDVLVVDNKKLHRTERITGRERQAIVITFLPELIYTLGSPVCDVGYLSPFYCQVADVDPVVRAGDPRLPRLHGAIERLLDCYADAQEHAAAAAAVATTVPGSGAGAVAGGGGGAEMMARPDSPLGAAAQLGCKTYLLELLYLLSQHFAFAEVARSECLQQQQRARRLGSLLEHLSQNYGRKISIADAATMVGMSESRFMRYFRAAAGMTFVSYLTHIRLTHAARLLRESDLNISEVADAVGFRDQSYFDRQFRQGFLMTPREYRAAGPHAALPTAPASAVPAAVIGSRLANAS